MQQLQSAISNANANVGGDYLKQGSINLVVRSVGILGAGKDPMEKAFAMKSPEKAADYLRLQEKLRIREIRSVVVQAINNHPILVDDLVKGKAILTRLPNGRAAPARREPDLGKEGVVVSHQTRLGSVSLSRPLDPDGKKWLYEPEKVQGIVLMHYYKEFCPPSRTSRRRSRSSTNRAGCCPGCRSTPATTAPA